MVGQGNKKRQPAQAVIPSEAGEVPSAAEELLWGINTVREFCLRNPRGLAEILIQRGKFSPKLQEIIDLARANQIRLRFVEPDRLGVPASVKHQGVVAKPAPVAWLSLDELLDQLELQTASAQLPRLLALDSLQDPHNVGAILRSAVAAGFTGVIMTRERSAPLSGTVAKVSAGAIAHLPICQVVNLSGSLKMLKKKGYWIFGSVAEDKALSLYECDFAVPLCLVIGAEGSGIRPLVRKQCDQLLTIPMQGAFDSLNASAAAAVIMFEIVRQGLAAATTSR